MDRGIGVLRFAVMCRSDLPFAGTLGIACRSVLYC